MKRLIAAPALALAALPSMAFAENCSQWTAGMQDTEGGRVMTAEVCSSSPNAGHTLSATCSATDFYFRWLVPDDTPNFPPAEEFHTQVAVSVGDQTQRLKAQYSPEDGAMEMELTRKSEFAKALKSGGSMVLKAQSKSLPSATFSLAGSLNALARLEAACAGQR